MRGGVIVKTGLLLVAAVGSVGLAGCSAGQEQASVPRRTTAIVASVTDTAAQHKAKVWLAGVVVPADAVKVDSKPADHFLDDVGHLWRCSPMVKTTGYWTVKGGNVTDVGNWLMAHPSDGLTTLGTQWPESTPSPDLANVDDNRSPTTVEGISFTVARSNDGVVIRAEVGIVPTQSVCQTPPPGQIYTNGG